MKCGILMIGSLLWEATPGRQKWRKERLDLSRSVAVRIPIHYGRRSSTRSDTFTMVLQSDGAEGIGILAPCRGDVDTVQELVAEAQALWAAEAPKAASGAIGANWGCVGVSFGSVAASEAFSDEWRLHFERTRTKPVAIVQPNGRLNMPWPTTDDGLAVDLDVILATATVPEKEVPAPSAIAGAILAQANGDENYFLNNVNHGIRTASDGAIWRFLEEASPGWLSDGKYSEAVEILRNEAA